MDLLADSLSGRLQGIVEDRTGLAGYYSLDVKFAPEGLSTAAPATADDIQPSLGTALREQLGLALETARAPVEVLVIDHVERPSAN
jgi:uncharacterized protein (TIGR03435 family)